MIRITAKLLFIHDNVKMCFVTPDVVRMTNDIKEFLSGRCALHDQNTQQTCCKRHCTHV